MPEELTSIDTSTALPPAGFTQCVVARAKHLASVDLPAAVSAVARQCVLDWFAVSFAGSREPLVYLLREQALEEGCRPTATVLGSPVQFSVRQAALINGAMGHALDYDDVNIGGHGHITAAVLPAALALAEAGAKSGAQLLSAFVAGYEAAVMVGQYVGREHYERGFHATSTVGTYGAAMASALLLGLDDEASARALGIAGTQAAGLKAQFGTMCKPLHAGKANENGVFGAQLARRGFTGRLDVLEHPQGMAFAQSPGGDLQAGLANSRAGVHIADNLFKFSAACHGTHGAIDGVRRLQRQHGFAASEVRKVTLRVEPGADRMCNIAVPRTGLEAKFSLRFNTALALTGEDTSWPATYSDEMAARADLRALGERVQVLVMAPGWSVTRTDIELETTDGRLLRLSHDTGVPASDLHTQGARLLQKFTNLTTPILGAARTDLLAARLGALEKVPDVRDLLSNLH